MGEAVWEQVNEAGVAGDSLVEFSGVPVKSLRLQHDLKIAIVSNY
jgi:hypothetical protein